MLATQRWKKKGGELFFFLDQLQTSSQTQQQPPSSPPPAIFSLRDLRMSQNKSKTSTIPSNPWLGVHWPVWTASTMIGLCFELETGWGVLWGPFTTVRLYKFVYLKLSWGIYISHLASLKAKGDSDMYPTLWTLNSAPDKPGAGVGWSRWEGRIWKLE